MGFLTTLTFVNAKFGCLGALNVEESRFDSVVVLGGEIAEAIFDGGGNFAGEGYFG